jgi:hypothetical protein
MIITHANDKNKLYQAVRQKTITDVCRTYKDDVQKEQSPSRDALADGRSALTQAEHAGCWAGFVVCNKLLRLKAM